MYISQLALEHIWAQQIPYIKCMTEYNYEKLPRPYSSIGYIEKGSAFFMQGDRFGELHAGDILFIPKDCTYKMVWTASEGSALITCHFNLTSPLLDDSQTFVQRVGTEDFNALEDFKKLTRLTKRRIEMSDSLAQSASMLEMMTVFYGICTHVLPKLELRTQNKQRGQLEPAIEYIRENFRNEIRIEELAKLCCLSQSHFYTKFRSVTGVSPIEYKNRITIARAEQILLAEPELPIETLSELLGFASGEYFRRVFKRITGLTPREFRKMGCGGL